MQVQKINETDTLSHRLASLATVWDPDQWETIQKNKVESQKNNPVILCPQNPESFHCQQDFSGKGNISNLGKVGGDNDATSWFHRICRLLSKLL